MARLFARLITLHQRHISPYKGFQCAYRVLHGGDSCSQYVKRMVLQQGVWNIFSTARKRFSECRYAKEALIRSRSNQSADSPNTSAEESPKKRRWFSHPLFEFADLPFDCCCSASAAAAASGANAAERGAEGAAGAADAAAEIASGGAEAVGAAAETVAGGAEAASGCAGGCVEAVPFDCCG